MAIIYIKNVSTGIVLSQLCVRKHFYVKVLNLKVVFPLWTHFLSPYGTFNIFCCIKGSFFSWFKIKVNDKRIEIGFSLNKIKSFSFVDNLTKVCIQKCNERKRRAPWGYLPTFLMQFFDHTNRILYLNFYQIMGHFDQYDLSAFIINETALLNCQNLLSSILFWPKFHLISILIHVVHLIQLNFDFCLHWIKCTLYSCLSLYDDIINHHFAIHSFNWFIVEILCCRISKMIFV